MRSSSCSPRWRSRSCGPSPARRSLTIAGRRDELLADAAADLADILLVLEDGTEGGVHHLLPEVALLQRHQRCGPVERLGDARHLVEVDAAEFVHEAADLARQGGR